MIDKLAKELEDFDRESFSMDSSLEELKENKKDLEKYYKMQRMMQPVTYNLFHSTGKSFKPEDLVKTKFGFDQNYSTDKDLFLGYGIYLADNACYSHFASKKKFCHQPEKGVNRYKIILARAVTGWFPK